MLLGCWGMIVLQIATGRWGAGSEIYALWLSRALARRGHRVFFAFNPSGRLAPLCPPEIVPVKVALWGTWDVVSAVKLAALVRRHRIPLLHAHRARGSVYALIASILAGVPWLVTIHVPQPALRFRLAALLLTVSEHARQALIAQGVPADRVKVIYAGIDPDDYAPTQKRRALARQLLSAGEDEWLVGFVGRMVADKGIPTLIALARRFKQRSEKGRLILIGDGPLRPTVEAIARDEGLPLQCLGFRPDVPLLLAGLDAYVHPSRYESFCLSVLEAMAAGLPVIASKVGGLPELVLPSSGILIDAIDNLDAWDSALQTLWRDQELARALGQAARQKVAENFLWHRFADEHAAVYEKVVAAWR